MGNIRYQRTAHRITSAVNCRPLKPSPRSICPAAPYPTGVRIPGTPPPAKFATEPLHLDEISRNVAEGAHAVLLLDRAGWHTTGKLDVPKNITPIFLPSHAPELNPVENVWQYLRQNWLSNTVFENYDAIT